MMSITNCPNCNSPVPPGSIFCDNCGFDLRTAAGAAQANLPPAVQPAEAGGGMIACPTCGYANIAGSAFCENCGSQLTQVPMPAPAASPMAPMPATEAPPAKPEPAAETPMMTIRGKLVIQSANATLTIPPGKQVIVIGREDPVSGIFPDIDLDPYGAQEEGVGRRHAQLVIRGGDVCVEDLESVNGTVVNKQRLVPRQPYPIKDGDEIRLGKMVTIYQSG